MADTVFFSPHASIQGSTLWFLASLLAGLLAVAEALTSWGWAIWWALLGILCVVTAIMRRTTPLVRATSDGLVIRVWPGLHPNRLPFKSITAVDDSNPARLVLTTMDGDKTVLPAEWFRFEEFRALKRLVRKGLQQSGQVV